MPHFNKKMISFFMTTKCNLCCRYCYNADERRAITEQTIPLDLAKAGIDWYFANTPYRHIRFYGPGEPTQAFEEIEEISAYAKNHPDRGVDVTSEIQTNGVFTENVRDWMLDNMNIMWMSFDGMPEIQNYNRPLNPLFKKVFGGKTSAEVLENNVRWLINNKGNRNLMVGARVTITDKTIDKQKEMVDYFYSLGIRHVWTNPEFYEVGRIPVCQDEIKKKGFHFDMDKYVKYYLEAYQYAKKRNLQWGSFLTINFDGESPYHCRCCDPKSAPHLTPDGYISACDMVVLGEEAYHMSPFIVGKWDFEKKELFWYEDKVSALNERKATNIAHCKSCPAKCHCGGYCLGETVNTTGHLDGQDPVKCKAIRQLFEKLGTCEPYPYLHP